LRIDLHSILEGGRMRVKRTIWTTSGCLLTLILSIVLLVTGCSGWGRPFHPTPLDALTEFPGKLTHADRYVEESVEVLQEQEVAGGLVLLYRWQSPKSQETDTYCLATTFVTPEGKGWRAQASGFHTIRPKELPSSWEPPLFGCEIAADTFVAGYTVGGNITSLTTASGLSHRGDAVHIVWSDGQIDVVPLKDGSFLLARPETLEVRRIELLDANGHVLESEEW